MLTRVRWTKTLDFWVLAITKRTLEAAASVSHQAVSAFVLESALARSEVALADRRTYSLTKARWAKFLAALNVLTRLLPQMQHFLKEPGFLMLRR